MKGTIYVSEHSRLPNDKHFAVLVNKSISYEQSWGPNDTQTCTDHYVQYIAFATQEDLENWILSNPRESFKVISSTPVKVTMKAVISLDVQN